MTTPVSKAIVRNLTASALTVKPSAALAAGTVVKVGDALIGVATSGAAANETVDLNLFGEYDVTITAGTQYAVGALVSCAAKTLDGTDATVVFGPAVKAVAATDSVARLRLVNNPLSALVGVKDSTGGTATGNVVAAPAGATPTAAEYKTALAVLSAKLNAIVQALGGSIPTA